MAFYANTFTFDSVPSEFYNLYLGEVSGSGESTIATSSDISILSQKLFRRPVPLYYGAEQVPVLSFPLSVYSPAEITAQDFSLISGWLFGQQNYKELRICQNDMLDIHYNAFLTEPQIIRLGNVIRGFTCMVVCDSPWGWKEPSTYDYVYSGEGYSVYDRVTLFNKSVDSFYTYPTNLEIMGNLYGGTVTITNESDANRQLILTLLPYEIVTLDCSQQLISSNLTDYPLVQFTNKNWLRLVKGFNILIIEGNITSVSITIPVAVKIG